MGWGESGELRKPKSDFNRGDPILRAKRRNPEGSQGCLRRGCEVRKGWAVGTVCV